MQKLILIAVLVAGLSAMVIPKQKSGVFRHDMIRSPSLKAKLIKEGKWKDVVKNLHVKSSGSQPIIDYYDDFYLVNVSTGTPAQTPFTVVPDTGSSNYWLIDANKCTAANCHGYNPPPKHLFDSTKSTTFSAQPGTPFSIQYGSGSCDGVIVTDTLQFAGLTITNQQFGLASDIADVFGYQPIDGIMGLGWPALAVDNVVPPMQNLLSQLDKPLFSVWLDRRVPIDMGDNKGGVITYGAIDSTNCDATINYVTLSSKTYWQFAMDALSVGSYSYTKSQQVISDTGTSWLGGPQAQINGIVQATGAQWDDENQLYYVSCTKTGLPDIVLTIGGVKYNIPAAEYVLDLELGGGNCAVTIFEFDFGGFGPNWILGDTFIRSYCNFYDIGGGRIGFSKAHHTSV